MSDLNDIKGVGQSTASSLKQSGIESVEGLAEAEPSDIDHISDGKAESIIQRASEQVISSTTAKEMLETHKDQEPVSTGSPALDDILGGGWEPETICLTYGMSGSGKTQIAFNTMSNAASDGKNVVYLMTEIQSRSISERLESLAESTDALDNIYIYQVDDVDEQYDAYGAIEEDLDDVDLIVIDSLTAQFRTEERFEGRASLGERSAVMGQHLRRIGELSRFFTAPVLATGQVYESPDRFEPEPKPWGGEKMMHFISYFLYMARKGEVFEASLRNHAGIPESTVSLRINESSITEAK